MNEAGRLAVPGRGPRRRGIVTLIAGIIDASIEVTSPASPGPMATP